ncbi:AtMMH-1 [Peniophora sp. CONT]|nr:AtMMH-1 [Peniophora sp. CONT]
MRELAQGKVIEEVQTTEDAIVFAGVTHGAFRSEILGRRVESVERYGKVFYLSLSGDGKMPVLHFGMTGMLQVKGVPPLHYREAPRNATSDAWPPRFMKFILHLRSSNAHETSAEPTQIAFLDARRLGRIRLCQSPRTEPPISAMGFDPIVSMPDLSEFKKGMTKRTCPIKALLLDQSFSAGVGNWVADEILYHARVHPEQRCHTLSDEQILALHRQTREVCRIAVEVNADDSQFPDNWLFKHRWGKGKKKSVQTEDTRLKLPDGEIATIKWVTVGGRTSAYISELQFLPDDAKTVDGVESDLTQLSEDDEGVASQPVKRKRKTPQGTAESTSRKTRAVRKRT